VNNFSVETLWRYLKLFIFELLVITWQKLYFSIEMITRKSLGEHLFTGLLQKLVCEVYASNILNFIIAQTLLDEI
jgi:hypothetical protein